MKTLRISSLLVVLYAALLVLLPARARAEVSFDFFYDNLTPYGEWVDVGDYGPCWRPTGVDADWAPYTDGYWAYTDAGWTWVSYEDFGSIVYHYGRWVRTEGDGWCWVPESEWAPAWVSWRTSDDYVGWAPLPPEAGWRRDVGIGIWVDSAYGIGPGYYSFCHMRDFGAPVLRGVIVDRGENITIIHNTVNITNITYNTGFSGGPVIFNGGPRFETVNRVSTRPIPALKLVTNANLDPAVWRNHHGPNGVNPLAARTVGNQLFVAAPQVAAPADMAAFRAKATKVIPAGKVTKGWGGVRDPKVQEDLKLEIQRQAKGLTPTTAPAHPVAAADLKVVPVKADPNAAPIGGQHEKPGKDRRPDGVATQPSTPPSSPKDRRPEGVATQPSTPPSSPKDRRPEGVATQPTNPPASPSNKPAAPFAIATPPGSTDGRKGRTKSTPLPPQAPITGNPALKPFNTDPEPKTGPQNPPTPKGPATVGNKEKEQERISQQKQISAQQEAAKSEDARRRAIDAQKQEQEQRGAEARHAQDAEKERGRPPVEAPRGGGQPQSHGNAPSSSPTHSKEGKDSKDKDKDKNGN